MARRIHRGKAQPLDRHRVTICNTYRYDVYWRLLAHHGDAVRSVAERPHGGDMIGMDMRIDHLHQPQVELLEKLQVTVRFLENGIDQQRLAAGPACKQIGVCRRHGIE